MEIQKQPRIKEGGRRRSNTVKSGESKMIHKITQSDIDAGEPGMCCRCPVALSLLIHYDYVLVDGDEILTLFEGQEPEHHNVPKKVAKFIKRFDAEESVEPMEFELED